MPTEFHQAEAIDVPEWVDTTDELLRRHVVARRPRSRFDDLVDRVNRWSRSFAQPLVHGAGALAAVVVVMSAIAVESPVPLTGSTADPPVVELPVAAPATGGLQATAPAMRLRPSYLPMLPADDLLAVVSKTDIPNVDGAFTREPPSTTPAVPTPEGGRSTTVALRPTVR